MRQPLFAACDLGERGVRGMLSDSRQPLLKVAFRRELRFPGLSRQSVFLCFLSGFDVKNAVLISNHQKAKFMGPLNVILCQKSCKKTASGCEVHQFSPFADGGWGWPNFLLSDCYVWPLFIRWVQDISLHIKIFST